MTKVEIALASEVEADAVALPVAQPFSEKLDDRLLALGKTGELRGERGEALLIYLDGDPRNRFVAAGVGKLEDVDADALRTAGAATAAALSRVGGTLVWIPEHLPVPLPQQAAALVEGTILGSYSPGRWKSKDESRAIERIVVHGEETPELRAAVERAAVVAECANRARDLSNMPPNELTPASLAETAEKLAVEHEHLTAESLGPKEMEKLGMGALLAVGQGSRNEPRLVVLRYEPPNPTSPDVLLGLVGKSITFDTGGISIKPGGGMQDMKGDMSGGAGTLYGIEALAALGTPVRAIALLAAAENMPGGGAFRPGDILTAANGKTIEVINTDAEGRLVLADALWYARREGATHVVDMATLTGAMQLALGDLYAGGFANDEAWLERIVEAGKRSGDLVWPFPLHPRYRRYINSDFADMKNGSTLREGSPVLAAEFLHEFAGEGPWAHIDMAGPAFLGRSRGDYLRVPGGTGWGVRLIAELGESFA
jgi:leucyl aminopeptidase